MKLLPRQNRYAAILFITLFHAEKLSAQFGMEQEIAEDSSGGPFSGLLGAILTLGLFWLLKEIFGDDEPKTYNDNHYDRKRKEELKRIAREIEEQNNEEYIQERRKNASPTAIDIGLSVKWASFNLGAYKPADVGSIFYWAENQPSVIGHPKFRNINVHLIGDFAGDEKYDAATNIYGKNWRLPTDEECKELLNKCIWETKVHDGIEGRLITGPNGNTMFLPFNQKSIMTGKYISGHYWTSTPHYHGKDSANDLRFGENCKQPAEIWSADACRCLFCIRPVFSTITRETLEKQKQIEVQRLYTLISQNALSNSNTLDIDYQHYQEQSIIRKEEREEKPFGFVCFAEDKIQRDEHGVIYSLDGKRLLDGSHCDCKTYRIKEGTEIVCNNAFGNGFMDVVIDTKTTLEKIILPSTLLYFPTPSFFEHYEIESLTPNYSIINDLLIDTRKKCIVKCLDCNIRNIEIYDPIEEIGKYAFDNCVVLQRVVLPKSLRRIGENAFRNCEMLCDINLVDSIETISASAFFNCKALHINHLPKCLSFLGDYAFQCGIIDGITIPKCIKEIGKNPFSKITHNVSSESSRFIIVKSLLLDSKTNELIQLVNSEVKQASIPDYVTKIRANAFTHTDIESITIPSTVKELGDGLFEDCKNLTKVQINCEIERLPKSIFARCSSLASFVVPDCIKVIEMGAFYQCSNLLEINLNQGLVIIENCAFVGCTRLASLNIPDSVRKIEKACVVDCSNLKEISIKSKEIEIEKGWILRSNSLRVIRVHVNTYERLLPIMPKERKIKIKKNYDHQYLFFKW